MYIIKDFGACSRYQLELATHDCKTLNHFKVVDRLGKGGMGEVYVAEDSKLKRKVALKVLPEEVARDPARLERFQREAESIAALNHPTL